MKIGVLTLPFNVNYGGILQAYALQTYLTSKGHEVYFINRIPGRPGVLIILKRILSLCKCVFKRVILRDKEVILSNPFGVGYVTRKYEDLDWSRLNYFVTTYLRQSTPMASTKQLMEYVDDMAFDCLLVGSDQVWRDCYSPNIFNYFLDFVRGIKIKRVAYAASFGVYDNPIPWYKRRKCIKLAHRFDAISVREDAAIGYMQKKFGIISVKVVDPTLLLSAYDYRKFIKTIGFQGDKYIVAYILNMTEEKSKILNLIRTHLGIELTILSSEPKYNNSQFAASVEEWLTKIANSEFVITDSYHGCVFAIQFRKPFIVISNESRGNERFMTLLSSLDLMDRIVDSYEQTLSKLGENLISVDYGEVAERLSLIKQTSMDFLLGALN